MEIDVIPTTKNIGWSDINFKRDQATVVQVTNGAGGDGQMICQTFFSTAGSGFTNRNFIIDGSSAMLYFGSNWHMEWANTTTLGGPTYDWGIKRDAAGVGRISNASTGIGALRSASLIVPRTTNITITSDMSGDTFTNDGATGIVVYTLPAATGSGATYAFFVLATQSLQIKAAGSDIIRNAASVTTGGGTMTNGTIGSSFLVRDVKSGVHGALTAPNGTWTAA